MNQHSARPTKAPSMTIDERAVRDFPYERLCQDVSIHGWHARGALGSHRRVAGTTPETES